MEMNKLCSCIVPCFNEEKVIPIYYDEMQKVMKQEENIEFEIIFVDDGSKDGTLEIMRKLSEQDPKVHFALDAEEDFLAFVEGKLRAHPDMFPLLTRYYLDPLA